MQDYFDLIQEHDKEITEAQQQNQEALRHGTNSFHISSMHKMNRS